MFFRKTLSNILIFQVLFISNYSYSKDNLKVDGKLTQLEKISSKAVSGIGCKGFGKGKLLKKGSLLACKTLKSTAANKTEIIRAAINAVTLVAMSTSLINSSCKRTEAGKKHLPKSYTANVTHWIHKLSALLFIYAQVQNAISLRKIEKKFKKLLKETDGQDFKFQTLLQSQKEKLKSLKKSKKILNIASLGFGASSAVELGLTSVNFIWGKIKNVTEGKKCIDGNLSLANCGVVGASLGTELKRYSSDVVDMGKSCIAQFKTINFAALAMKEAKSQVAKQVSKGVEKLVGPIASGVSSTLSQNLGGGKIGELAGSAGGDLVGSTVAKSLSKSIATTTESMINSSDSFSKLNESASTEKSLAYWKKQPTECITKKGAALAKQAAVGLIQSAAVDGCAATGGLTCGPAIALACATKAITSKEGCLCTLRAAKDLPGTLKKILGNSKDLPPELIKNEELLAKLYEDIKKDKRLIRKGVDRSDDICGIDRVNWGVRSDLVCKSLIKLKDGDKKVKGDENVKDALFFESILNSSNRVVVDDLLEMEGFKDSFDRQTFDNKKKVNKTLKLLVEGINSLRKMMISEAVADVASIEDEILVKKNQKTADQKEVGVLNTAKKDNEFKSAKKIEKPNSQLDIVNLKSEVSLAAGLGLTGIALLVFPKVAKELLRFTAVMHRSPLRRGIYFLATYLLSRTTYKSIDTSITQAKKEIKQLKEYLKSIEIKERDESNFTSLLKKINFIPLAFSSLNREESDSVMLCFDGGVLSRSCQCSLGSGCKSSQVTPLLHASKLEELKPVNRLLSAQRSVLRKMERGQMLPKDYTKYEKQLTFLSKDLNPLIAADNLSFALKELGVEVDILKESKVLVAALESNSYKVLEEELGGALDKIDFDQDIKETERSEVIDTNKNILSDTKKRKVLKRLGDAPIDSIAPTMKTSLTSKKVKSLDDFVINVNDINKRRSDSIFKIISRRYIKNIEKLKDD